MYCDNCGSEIADGATFCSNCGNRVVKKHKNIYVALILSFILTGLGSIYAGNVKRGVILLILRLATAFLSGVFNLLFIASIVVWVYGFYQAYLDVSVANGNANPKLLDDFGKWDKNNKIIAVMIVFIILFLGASASVGFLVVNNDLPSNSGTHYYVSDSGSGSSSSSSHYGGVDDSPWTVAKNDPDWYYDHYDYGDNDEIDEYLESQGYD